MFMETPTSNKFYPLPCMLTCTSLFSGFYSIVASINGHFYAAAVAILIAAIFDGLDGRVARMTGSTSRFGMELDSLCDLVSFGVAPALLAYLWALTPYGRYGWLAAFLFVATTALRLARFNSMALAGEGKTADTEEKGSHDFIGLPCPAAAGMIATTVMFCRFLGAEETVKHISLLLLVYILSYLMVSTHPYQSFKQINLSREKKFQAIVGMVLLLILLATEPPVTLFIVSLIYILSGPVMASVSFLAGQRQKIGAGKNRPEDL
jgi:CDP-diacylglycerol--serine O-phosphatidyltransferase